MIKKQWSQPELSNLGEIVECTEQIPSDLRNVMNLDGTQYGLFASLFGL